MDDHLPECPSRGKECCDDGCDGYGHWWDCPLAHCICPALRSCEAREREAAARLFAVTTMWTWDEAMNVLTAVAQIRRGGTDEPDVEHQEGCPARLDSFRAQCVCLDLKRAYDRGYREGYNAHAAAQQRALVEYGGRPSVSREAPGGS